MSRPCILKTQALYLITVEKVSVQYLHLLKTENCRLKSFYRKYEIFYYLLHSRLWPRLGVNYFEKVINYIQLHWKLFN